MKTLLTVSTPQPINGMFDNLFVQVASKHGCGDHLYIQQNRRSVACNAGCSNCRVTEILNEFQKNVETLTRKASDMYTEHIVENEIWAPEDNQLQCTPLKSMISHR